MSTENTNTKTKAEITLKDVAEDAQQWMENRSSVVKGIVTAVAVKVGKRLARRHWITLGIVLGVGLAAKLISKRR